MKKLKRNFRRGVKNLGRLYLGRWDKRDIARHSFSKDFAKGLGLSKRSQDGIVNYDWTMYKIYKKILKHKKNKMLISPSMTSNLISSSFFSSVVGFISRNFLLTAVIFIVCFLINYSFIKFKYSKSQHLNRYR